MPISETLEHDMTEPGQQVNVLQADVEPPAAAVARGTPPPDPNVTFREFGDTTSLRNDIFARVQEAVATRFPVENERYAIQLDKVAYKGPESYSLKDQKQALLKRQTLQRKLYGRWRMIDKETGSVVDEREEMLANVPYLTERGTFIRNGSEYTVANQSRLRSGVYTHHTQAGDVQAQFNIQDGGPGFKLQMDPRTGKVEVIKGSSKMSLVPVLREMGVSSDDIAASLGAELFRVNNVQDKSAERARKNWKLQEGESLAEKMAQSTLDPEVSVMTLGQPYDRVTPEVLLATVHKMVQVGRGETEEDNRDAIHFQKIMTPDQLFAERITRDAKNLVRNKLLWQSTHKGKLTVKPGYLSPQVDSVFIQSGLAQPLEEVNPVEILDQQYRLLRTGEGGVDPSRVTMESRSVQPSHFGVIDPIRSPESGGVGTDSRFTINALHGSDGKIYSRLRDIKTGEVAPVNVEKMANSIIAFPGELEKDGRRVRAMVRGKLDYIDRRFVQYELPHTSAMSTIGINLVPGVSSALGGRVMMAGKMLTQALPLEDNESPLVQALSDEEGLSFEEKLGVRAGAVRSDTRGTVVSVTDDMIKLQTPEGVKKVQLYNNFPLNRKTFIHNTPSVQPGDKVKPGDLLARSNFTDANGTLGLGKNLRTAYMVWPGNTDDGIIISESAAQRLRSDHMYSKKLDHDSATQRGRKEFTALYPGKFSEAQIKMLDDDGVVKPGMRVKAGDPLVLAVREKPLTDLHKGHKAGWMDASETWDHEADGIITDVEKTGKGVRISVRSFEPMQVGDKLSGRFGDKGVVAGVIPDDKMPRDAEGNPVEVILNPATVVTRTNPSQLIELALGKVAQKTGKPIKLPAFMKESLIEYAQAQLDKHGIRDTEELVNPDTGRAYHEVMVGPRFFMKLHHMAEHKLSGRGVSGYTSEKQPARGGDEGAKRLGLADINALVSHGATEVLKDAKTIRGQENREYWKAFQMGRTPPSPDIPFIYRKMIAHMIGSGVNITKSGNQLHTMALTDKDIDKLSHGEITEARGVDLATMREMPGGLFDKSVTGGHGGSQWGHITLSEPLPNPVMEEPIRRLLGLTQKRYEAILSGEEQLHDRVGGEAFREALKRIDLKALKRQTQTDIDSGARSRRDDAIKRMRYINMFEKSGMKPEEMVMTKVPVLPPQFRPVSVTDDFAIKADVNALYMDLMQANNGLRDLRKEGFAENQLGEDRLNLYRSFKAVTGLGDPISPKLKQQEVTGLLRQVFGKSSPKLGMFQRRVLGGTLDTIGRAVITPNPSYDMDTAGIPEAAAWKLYRPFVVRKLITRGMAPTDAVRNVVDRSQIAAKTLEEEMEHRPIIITRAPTLHKYNLMAVKPKLVKGSTLQVSPLITKGFNADFDGDQMNFHVPVSDKAVQEAKERMLPSRNLFAIKDFDVHYVPDQEFQHGLYMATQPADRKSRTVRFLSKEDAVNAYKRGEIDVNTPIEIVKEGR